MAEEQSASLTPDADSNAAPRLRLGEVGYLGLATTNGRILEESKRELMWPNCLKTYRAMAMDTTLGSAISLYEMMISRVNWKVVPPQAATEKEKARAEFVQQCMDDMEHTWFDFIKEVTSVITYGFSVHEKVYRRRLRANGSKYNDGLMGLRKLPIRSQDTISKWLFSEDGRELLGVEQDIQNVIDRYNFKTKNGVDTKVTIPRNKFLLFRTNVKRDNPEGSSPLKSCYVAWRWRSSIEEHEAIGISREMRGIPVVYIPVRYMSPDATTEEKAVYEYYKDIVRNLHLNEQAGLVLPSAYDVDARQPMFKFELLSVTGTKGYDTSAVIQRYDNKMLMAFFSDLLKMGQEKVGSFSLAGAKTNILAMAIEHRLKEIQSVLNKDLIPQLFALNQWTDERLPEFQFDDLDEEDLEDFSKAIQRISSVGALEIDRDALDSIRVKLGFKPKGDDEPVDKEAIPAFSSKAGQGMAKGSGNGTADSPAGRDNSVSNAENSVTVLNEEDDFTIYRKADGTVWAMLTADFKSLDWGQDGS